MTARFTFAWYDVWVGAYWDRARRVLYICPLPMLCFAFALAATPSPSPEGASE